MNLDEIAQYVNEDSVKGELAREFVGIVSDYQAGTITLEEKNDLVNAVIAGFNAANISQDEDTARWIANAGMLLVNLV